MTRYLHATHGVSFADLSEQFADEHPSEEGVGVANGVRFVYDSDETRKATEKSPTGIAAKVYSFATENDELADFLLNFEEYGVTEYRPAKKEKAPAPKTKAEQDADGDAGSGDGDGDDNPPADNPQAKPAAKKAAAPRARGGKARASAGS